MPAKPPTPHPLTQRPRRRPPRALALVAPLLVLAVAGACSSGPAEPAATDFSAGACRAAAPAVLSIGRTVRGVQHDGSRALAATAALTRDQQRLRALPRAADPAARAELARLVTAIGLYRLHAVGHTLSGPAADTVAAAQRRLVDRCVRGGTP